LTIATGGGLKPITPQKAAIVASRMPLGHAQAAREQRPIARMKRCALLPSADSQGASLISFAGLDCRESTSYTSISKLAEGRC